MSNSIYSNYSLDSLLMQDTINKLNTISSTTVSDLSYAKILEAMKKKVDAEDEKTLSELSALEERYKKEMAPIRMFDLFHDVYINNGFFGTNSKSKLRNAKYNAWGNIFSLQAERVNAQAQIALKNLLQQTAQKIK